MNVRLQQGVPLIDADWNELDDIRKFEVRAFFKWFMGNGVPAGSDSFRIEGIGDSNDFLIHSGVVGPVPAGISNQEKGLRFAGNCLVDGMIVSITDDIKFSNQPLHSSQNPSPALLGTTLGAGAIKPLQPSPADTNVVVYLDVWEHLVTAADDPTLIPPGIGIESCARIKREWAVRVDAKIPIPNDPTYFPGHSYYELALIAHRANDPVVKQGDVTDLRQTHLTLSDLMMRVSLLEQDTLLPSFDPSNQFNPPSGPVNTLVSFHGKNLTVGSPRVFFGNVAATVIGTTFTGTIRGLELFAQVPPGVTGKVTITVITDADIAVSKEMFTVLPPPTFAAVGTQFSPTSIVSNAPVQVTLSGSNFDGPNPAVTFNAVDNAGNITGTFPVGISNVTATQIITAVISNVTTAGKYKISVKTDGGSIISDDVFTVTAKAKETKEKEKDKEKEKEIKEIVDKVKEKDKEKEKEKEKEIIDKVKDHKEGGKEHIKTEAEKVTDVRFASIPTGSPFLTAQRSETVEEPPATGQAFISSEERPDVAGNALQQADQEQRGSE